MQLFLYRALWRLLRRLAVGCHRHELVVHALSRDDLFPSGNAVEDAALLVGMQFFGQFGTFVPSDPATWAFCVYSRCLEDERVAETIAMLDVGGRRAAYREFRDRAAGLWNAALTTVVET